MNNLVKQGKFKLEYVVCKRWYIHNVKEILSPIAWWPSEMQIFGHPQGELYLSLCEGPILGMYTPNEVL